MGDSSYIYQSELDIAWFQYDMAYGDFKDLNRRTISDKVLRDKAFNIAQNWKYGYQLDKKWGSLKWNYFWEKISTRITQANY